MPYTRYPILLPPDANHPVRPLVWLGSSKKDYNAFPKQVQSDVGFALYRAQIGDMPRSTKPIRGLGAGIMEIVSGHDGDAYRTVYMARFEEAVYVLHAFQKKSKRGIETPKKDMDLIRQRLKEAQQHHTMAS